MHKFLLITAAIATLGACEGTKQTSFEQEADFWERRDGVSMLYLRGPKAQTQLHQDIATCVNEVKELSRLGTINNARPPAGIRMNQGLAEKWQSPERNGALRTEYAPFTDFESCMSYNGWKRVSYVRPEQVYTAKSTYDTVILGKSRQDDDYDRSKDKNHSSRSKADGALND
jgi:hypothetical protein